MITGRMNVSDIPQPDLDIPLIGPIVDWAVPDQLLIKVTISISVSEEVLKLHTTTVVYEEITVYRNTATGEYRFERRILEPEIEIEYKSSGGVPTYKVDWAPELSW